MTNAYGFKDLVERYWIYLQTHRWPYHPRASAHVENPTGQLLRRWDDGRGAVEPDDDYKCDDSVVDDDDDDDDEKEIYQEDGSDFETDNTTFDFAVDDDSDRHDEEDHTYFKDAGGSVAQAETLLPFHGSPNISQTLGSDSDDDILLDELRGKTIIKCRKNKRHASLNNRRITCFSSSGEETDAAGPRQNALDAALMTGLHVVRQPAETDSHDAESDEPETCHRHQLS
ncbi:hypothetical protein C8R48DRAFT_673183 [Suillus tomentosus]|nr:hypothetical protein C8R48DRAFT_673183 [Suillus tomentosus]